MRICTKCGLVIAPEIEKAWDRNTELRNVCPNSRCYGSSTLIEVDEAIGPIICELNRKGYTTEFSCAGHIYEHAMTPYVMFDHINTGETIYPSFEDLKMLTQYHWYFDIEDFNTWVSKLREAWVGGDNFRISRLSPDELKELKHLQDDYLKWDNERPGCLKLPMHVKIGDDPSPDEIRNIIKQTGVVE